MKHKFARSKVKALKHYAEQLMFSYVSSSISEPHQVVVCCKCGSNKGLEFRTTGDGETYYKCSCGFESESLGKASFPRKGFDIP